MKTLLTSKRFQLGFTLIELLIVVAIIVVLVSLGAVSYTTAQRNARDAQRQSDLKKIALALEKFHSDHGEYPELISCLTGGAGCDVPVNTYMTALPLDPRTNGAYQYTRLADSDPGVGESYQAYELRMAVSGYEGTLPSEFDPLRSPNN